MRTGFVNVHTSQYQALGGEYDQANNSAAFLAQTKSTAYKDFDAATCGKLTVKSNDKLTKSFLLIKIILYL